MQINAPDKRLVSPIANCALVFCAFYIAFRNKKAAINTTSVVAQCCNMLLCVLAFENCTTWLDYLELTAVMTMPLFTLSSSGYLFYQAVNFANFYQVLKVMDSKSPNHVVCICLHAYLSLSHLDSYTNTVLHTIKNLLMYTKERQLLKLSWTRNIVKSDLGELPKHMRLGTLAKEFKYDINESMFLIRAIVRMVWRPMIPFYILGSLFAIFESLDFLRNRDILNMLDSNAFSWNKLYKTIVMGFVMDIMASQMWRVESYIRKETDRVSRALEFELFRLPLTSMKHFRQDKYNMPGMQVSSIMHNIACTQEMITILPKAVTQIALLYMQVGWFMFTPVVVKITLLAISKMLTLVFGPSYAYSSYSYFDDHYFDTDEIYHNIRSIKMFGWERTYLDPKLKINNAPGAAEDKFPWFSPIAKGAWFIYELAQDVSYELSTCLCIYLYCRYDKSGSTFSNADVYNITNIASSVEITFWQIYNYFDSMKFTIQNIYEVEKSLKGRPTDALSHSMDNNVGPVIRVDDGEFKWDSETLAAKNVSFTANPGDLVAVVGKTASGKSSLLYSLCSEVEMTNGTGLVNGSVAYVEQSPWIMSGTLRDNILFGREFDEEYYNEVIYACALDTDIKGWKDRDLTVIGERGINISGGQKTRLALARALYSKADIYILDDPLSAIDAHVKRHILDHVIMSTGMLKAKIRIVSSNDDKIIPYFNTILTVHDCCVTTSSQIAKKYQSSSSSPMHKEYIHSTDTANVNNSNQVSDAETNTKTAKHKVSSNITYILKLCGLPLLASLALPHFFDPIRNHIFHGLELKALNANTENIDIKNGSPALKLVYIEIVKRFVSTISYYITNKIETPIFNNMHSKVKPLFGKSLLYAPLSFYDSKLRQQIAADKFETDDISYSLKLIVVDITSTLLSSILDVYKVWAYRPQLLLAIPFLATMEMTKNVSMRPLERSLDKIQSNSYVENGRINDIIADGKHLIRIYGVGKHFIEKYVDSTDEQMSIELPTSNLRDLQSLISRSSNEITTMLCKLCLVFVSSYKQKRLTSGDYITYKRLVGGLTNNIVSLTNIPNSIQRLSEQISLLREYSDAEQETLFNDKSLNPENVWPTKGKIEFRDFSMKYREDLEHALKNINLTINPGEKIGIVGRTGAGKSSIARAIFRLINNDLCTGSITIDGYDTSKMDLGYLRPKLGIIPQDPTLFNSSFKKNFDPLQEYTIEDMWAGVIKCGITELVQPKRNPEDKATNETWEDHQNRNIQKDIDRWDKEYKDATWKHKLLMLLILTKPKLIKDYYSYIGKVKHGLDKTAYMEYDFSNGQRQLFSLCRLVIRQHKLIVLDEATSSVDLDTDQEMHNLIRSEFKDSTVLTIAHRLETIMKSDRIIVMEKGQIAEIGTPAELLEAKGLFSELVKANDFGE